jgi:phage/conjugal plasmid C-4 type zinc finger TraR family protein
MNEIESLQHAAIEEVEIGQLNAQILNDNGIAAVRRRIATGPSLEDCTDCGESIPLARRIAVQGCLRCIHCQSVFERKM